MKNVTLKNKAQTNTLRSNEHEYPDYIVPGCASISLPGPFTNLSALFDANTRTLALNFDSVVIPTDQESVQCKTHIQVLDMVGYRIVHIFHVSIILVYHLFLMQTSKRMGVSPLLI